MLENGRPATRRSPPYRPLPLLPLLHDDLPVGRATTCTWSTMPARISRRPTGGRCADRLTARAARRGAALSAGASARRCGWRGFGRPFAALVRRMRRPEARLAAMLELAPRAAAARRRRRPAAASSRPTGARGAASRCSAAARSRCSTRGSTRRRSGCSTRLGVEVVLAEGEGCCGALVHHMGREAGARASRARNIDAWTREIEAAGSTRS